MNVSNSKSRSNSNEPGHSKEPYPAFQVFSSAERLPQGSQNKIPDATTERTAQTACDLAVTPLHCANETTSLPMNSDMDDALEVVKLSYSAVLDRVLLKELKEKEKQKEKQQEARLVTYDSKQSQEGQELLWVEQDVAPEEKKGLFDKLRNNNKPLLLNKNNMETTTRVVLLSAPIAPTDDKFHLQQTALNQVLQQTPRERDESFCKASRGAKKARSRDEKKSKTEFCDHEGIVWKHDPVFLDRSQ